MIPKVLEVPMPPSLSRPEMQPPPTEASKVEFKTSMDYEHLTALATALGKEAISESTCTWRDAFCKLADSLLNALILVDMSVPGLPITYCNSAFEQLTGWPREQAIGQNCRILQGPGTEAAPLSELINAVRGGMDLKVQLTNYRKDGTSFVNALMLTPVRDTTGALRFSIGVLSDMVRLQAEPQNRLFWCASR